MARPKKSPKSEAPLAKVEASPPTVSFATGGVVPEQRKRTLSVIDMAPRTDEEREALAKREWAPLLEERPFQLAFKLDPHNHNADYTCLYRTKPKGIPDPILKQMAVGDSLVGTIVRARENHTSAFGRPRPSRLEMGFYFEWNDKRAFDRMSQEERDDWQKRQRRASDLLVTCGRTDGWKRNEQCSLGQWLKETTHSALTVGRIATEIVEVDGPSGEREFHSFRAVDAGTIYPTIKSSARGGDQVRKRSEQLLRHLSNDQSLQVPEDEWDRYEYVQVIDGNPVQVFTDEELRTKNFFPVPDVEYQGFPVTPCDIAVTEILTHISIGRQNQLYFQNGRAARGFIVITSEEADQDLLMQMRQQFMASINGNQSAHRMPLFGVPPGDTIQWQPMDNSSRDMEFQYLSDNTSRAILSVYGMSPDELPGYTHLSRGTNSQALSEGNNEFKLEAARDVGIRPHITSIEAFINDDILPLVDAKLAQVCRLRLTGLDAQTKDQEDADLTRLISLDGSLNDVLTQKEKQTLGKHLAAGMPLNQQWQALLQAFIPVGVIKEELLGIEGASKDPRYAYVRDPFYWQQLENAQGQLEMVLQPPMMALAPLVLPGILLTLFPYLEPQQAQQAAQQMLVEAQQMQMQAQMQVQQNPQEGDEQSEQGGGGEGEPAQKAEALGLGIHRRLLGKQRRIVTDSVRGLSKELDKMTLELLGKK